MSRDSRHVSFKTGLSASFLTFFITLFMMKLQVIIQMTSPSKSFLTFCAFVWFLLCMSSHVCIQVTSPVKCCLTSRTFVSVWSLPWMNFHVLIQITSCGKCHITFCAFVWLLSCMGPHVLFYNTWWLSECFLTFCSVLHGSALNEEACAFSEY